MVDDNSEYGSIGDTEYDYTERQPRRPMPVCVPASRPSLVGGLRRHSTWLVYHATHTPGYAIKDGRVVAASPKSDLEKKVSEE